MQPSMMIPLMIVGGFDGVEPKKKKGLSGREPKLQSRGQPCEKCCGGATCPRGAASQS